MKNYPSLYIYILKKTDDRKRLKEIKETSRVAYYELKYAEKGEITERNIHKRFE